MNDLRTEFETALKELRDLYDDSLPIEERKMQLDVRKELNKLLGLYCKTIRQDDAAEDDAETTELLEVRAHLEPLGLAPEGTTVTELARLAALKISQT